MTVEMVALGRSSWERLGLAGRLLALALPVGSLVTVAVWLPDTWRIIGAGVALLVLSLAALIDLAEHRLPNGLAVAGLISVLVTLALVAVAEDADTGGSVAISSLVGAAVVAGPLFVMHLVSPGGMGFGDVKAAIVLGGVIGLIDAWASVWAVLVASLATSVIGLVTRQRSVPFGPGLVGGSVVALLVAAALGATPVS